jgi:hypothetical protein
MRIVAGHQVDSWTKLAEIMQSERKGS